MTQWDAQGRPVPWTHVPEESPDPMFTDYTTAQLTEMRVTALTTAPEGSTLHVNLTERIEREIERRSERRLEPVLKFVRLPDGRWAVENGTGVEDVTREDIEAMHGVWMLWANLRWDRAGS